MLEIVGFVGGGAESSYDCFLRGLFGIKGTEGRGSTLINLGFSIAHKFPA
jgi:hypothetical protein